MPDKKANTFDSLERWLGTKTFRYGLIAALLVIVAIAFIGAGSPQGNLPKCLGIIVQQYRDTCLNSLALTTSNYSVCSYLPSGQSNSCINLIAQNTSNPSLCSKISTQNGTQECMYEIAYSTGSYSLCNKLNQTDQPICITEVASSRSQPAACSNVTSGAAENVCVNSATLDYALVSRNPAQCLNLNSSENASFTAQVAYYSGVFRNAGNLDTNLSLGLIDTPLNYVQFLKNVTYGPQDLCYLYMASALSSQTYCHYVKNSTISNICLTSVSQGSPFGQSTAQNQSYGPLDSNLSINSLANASIFSSGFCANISVSNTECDSLYHLLNAVVSENLTQCGDLSGINQYQCYASVARAYNDSSVCSYITNATVNSACLQSLYNNTN